MNISTHPENFGALDKSKFVFRTLFFLVAIWALADLAYALAAFGLVGGGPIRWAWSWPALRSYLSSLAPTFASLIVVLIAWDLQRGQFLHRRNLKRLIVIATCFGFQLWIQIGNAIASQFHEGNRYSHGFWWDLRSASGYWIYPLQILVTFSFWAVFALLVARAIRLDEENRLTI